MYYVYICSRSSSSSKSRWDSRGCNIPIYTHKRKCYFNARVRGVHPSASNHPPLNIGLNGSRVRANHPRRYTTTQLLYTHIYVSWRHGAWLLVAPGALPSIRSQARAYTQSSTQRPLPIYTATV